MTSLSAQAEDRTGIVFVHGILSSRKVWEPLAQLVVGDADLAGFDAHFFEYSSPPVGRRPGRRIPDLDVVAGSLGTFLEHVLASRRRVVLVGHSQGGLVIQQYMHQMLIDGRGHELARIRLAVLFACPNDGSQYLSTLRAATRWMLRNPQERGLQPLDERLAAMRRTVINRVVAAKEVSPTSCPIDIVAYLGETDGIVSPQSARGIFSRIGVLPGDHSTIVRPESAEDLVFVALRNHLLGDLLRRDGDPTERDRPASGPVPVPVSVPVPVPAPLTDHDDFSFDVPLPWDFAEDEHGANSGPKPEPAIDQSRFKTVGPLLPFLASEGHMPRQGREADIGLWGGAGSGKTCLLAAMNAACASEERLSALTGLNEESAMYLAYFTDSLIRERRFPEATSSACRARWLFTGAQVREPRGLPGRKPRIPTSLVLNIVDSPGRYFHRDSPESGVPRHDAYVFLFDVVAESESRDNNAAYFHRTMQVLEHVAAVEGRLVDGRLPHRLAVCVAKFDDPRVFSAALDGGFVAIGRDGVPRVPDHRAEAFFRHLCTSVGGGDAALVDYAIRRHFHPDRVRYFATSSIGFYQQPGKQVDLADCHNVTDRCAGRWIRGDVRPVNVLEPLLWLSEPTG
ncbi:MAG: alpha/beta fold hydrolase [Streptomycetaceae bacterium]|nr:alpha/beta fold hydrolase [Streptomycetaceae bacterium]